jgi:hypothetical protein
MGRLQKVNLKDKILLAVELHAKICPCYLSNSIFYFKGSSSGFSQRGGSVAWLFSINSLGLRQGGILYLGCFTWLVLKKFRFFLWQMLVSYFTL